MRLSKLKPVCSSIPAAALFSFLKENRGLATWTTGDLAKALRLSADAAKQALAVLQMQGYVRPAGAKGEWLTTEAREAVSGSKFPRYSSETVEQSLASLSGHLKRINQDSSADYKIAEAVAFGDFLTGRARVQAADVGIGLVPRHPREHESKSASEREKQDSFLKQLKGKTPLLNVQSYAEWMSVRTHRKL